MVRRIAMLFPIDNVAESETMKRIAIAAQRMGIEARAFRRSEDILSFQPDFVLSLTHQDPKLTPFPTYGVVTAPSRYYMQTARFVRNILTYDAYFTVSDTVVRWLKDVQAGAGKIPAPVGYYANTVQRTGRTELTLENPRLAYFGTNWDGQRHADLFDDLSRLDFMEFYGPPESWRHVGPAYHGCTPFDGVSTLDVYRRCGLGLCLSMHDFEQEDLPTNRIFEVTAAGALPIATRNRFIERHFGDAVLYIDPLAPAANIARQIETHMAWVATHPDAAREKARRCWSIFDSTLHQEKMLETVLTVHDEVLNRRGYRNVPKSSAPSVSYIVRTGDCDAESLRPALRSLAEQSHPIGAVVLVLGRPINVLHLQRDFPDLAFTVIEAFGAMASTALAAGLTHIGTDLFGVLDPDVRLHPNHVQSLVATLDRADAVPRRAPAFLAYGAHAEASASELLPERLEWQGPCMIPRQEGLRLGGFQPFDLRALAGNRSIMHPCAWLARRNLLNPETLDDPELEAEDVRYLLLRFARQADFIFSCELTLTHQVDGPKSFPLLNGDALEAIQRRIHLRHWHHRFAGELTFEVPGYDPATYAGYGVSRTPPELVELLRSMGLQNGAVRNGSAVDIPAGGSGVVLVGYHALVARTYRLSLYMALASEAGAVDGPIVQIVVVDDSTVQVGPFTVSAQALREDGQMTRFDWVFNTPEILAGKIGHILVVTSGRLALTIQKMTIRPLA